MNFLERFWTGCGNCHGGETCPIASLGEQQRSAPFGQGGYLVAGAVTVFLLPICTVILGAYFAGRQFAGEAAGSLGRWQVAGAFVGLTVGIGVAKLLVAALRRAQGPGGGVE